MDTPDEMFQAIMRHIKASFNDGKPLNELGLMNGSIIQIAAAHSQFCNLSGEDKAYLDGILEKAKKISANQQNNS